MSLQLGLGESLWLLPALGEQLSWSPVGLCLYSGCSQVSAFPLGMGEVGTAHGISSTGALCAICWAKPNTVTPTRVHTVNAPEVQVNGFGPS